MQLGYKIKNEDFCPLLDEPFVAYLKLVFEARYRKELETLAVEEDASASTVLDSSLDFVVDKRSRETRAGDNTLSSNGFKRFNVTQGGGTPG